jgi:hypothetical protein
MTRAVLVGYSTTDWKLYRQPQWMAEVRRNPEGALLPKRYFDLEETAYRQALDRWAEAGSSLEAAVGLLAQVGAIEITRS